MEEAEDFVADLNANQEFDMYIPNILTQGGFGGIGGQPGFVGLQPPNQVPTFSETPEFSSIGLGNQRIGVNILANPSSVSSV